MNPGVHHIAAARPDQRRPAPTPHTANAAARPTANAASIIRRRVEHQTVNDGIVPAGFAVLPACAGVAVLKYRLYDIDRIVSRVLSYAIITSALAGLVLLASAAFPLKGSAAAAAATLAAAALFNPLRRRVQRAVDRRFNRARYNAGLTGSAFASRLKAAADPGSVREDVAAVVQKALGPARTSVWMNEPGETGRAVRAPVPAMTTRAAGGPLRLEKN